MNLKVKEKFILIGAVTFVMSGAQPVYFAWSHQVILPEPKPEPPKIFSIPRPCFQELHNTGMDSRP